MSLIKELFGKSPFGPLAQHAKKVHECVQLICPLMEACIKGDHEEIHRIQDQVSKHEYEADKIKHEIREQLPRRYFMPVEREDLDNFLHSQDEVADCVQDFAVILFIRKTIIHPSLANEFREFVNHIVGLSQTLMNATEEMQALAEASFGGAEAKSVLERIGGLSEGEWMADRLQRKISKHIYSIEDELDPITIIFYEKMLHSLSGVANAAENTGDLLRQMIIK